jgi:hypothetical protein
LVCSTIGDSQNIIKLGSEDEFFSGYWVEYPELLLVEEECG